MICFIPNLGHYIGLKILYLPFGDHPKVEIYIEIQNVVYVLLLEILFLKIDTNFNFIFCMFFKS
jgi:hypothetical protein